MAKSKLDQNTETAGYLIAEFNAIQQRAINLENLRSSRINFFLITTGAIVAGFGGLINSPVIALFLSSVSLFSCIIVLLIGVLTLYNTINDSVTIVYLWRYAARIRRYFTTIDKEMSEYLPFPSYDDKPGMAKAPLSLRGSEASLLVINATAASLAVFLFMGEFFGVLTASIIAISVFPIGLVFQVLFIKWRLNVEERASSFAIKFPSPKAHGKK